MPPFTDPPPTDGPRMAGGPGPTTTTTTQQHQQQRQTRTANLPWLRRRINKAKVPDLDSLYLVEDDDGIPGEDMVYLNAYAASDPVRCRPMPYPRRELALLRIAKMESQQGSEHAMDSVEKAVDEITKEPAFLKKLASGALFPPLPSKPSKSMKRQESSSETFHDSVIPSSGSGTAKPGSAGGDGAVARLPMLASTRSATKFGMPTTDPTASSTSLSGGGHVHARYQGLIVPKPLTHIATSTAAEGGGPGGKEGRVESPNSASSANGVIRNVAHSLKAYLDQIEVTDPNGEHPQEEISVDVEALVESCRPSILTAKPPIRLSVKLEMNPPPEMLKVLQEQLFDLDDYCRHIAGEKRKLLWRKKLVEGRPPRKRKLHAPGFDRRYNYGRWYIRPVFWESTLYKNDDGRSFQQYLTDFKDRKHTAGFKYGPMPGSRPTQQQESRKIKTKGMLEKIYASKLFKEYLIEKGQAVPDYLKKVDVASIKDRFKAKAKEEGSSAPAAPRQTSAGKASTRAARRKSMLNVVVDPPAP